MTMLFSLFFIGCCFVFLMGSISRPNLREPIDLNTLHDEFKSHFKKFKNAKKYAEAPLDLSNLFDNWYMPVEHREVFMEKARNDPKFYQKLVNTNDKMILSIKERIIHNQNMIILISGQPGSGKSIIGLAIMQLVKEIRFLVMKEEAQKIQQKLINLTQSPSRYLKNPTKELIQQEKTRLTNLRDAKLKAATCKLHIAFNAAQLVMAIKKKMGPGDIVQCDEWENMIGEGAKTELNKLSNLMATMRFTGKCVILCTPMKIWLTGMTAKFIPFGQNKTYFSSLNPADKKSRCIWLTTPVYATSDKEEFQLGYIILDIGRIAKLEKKYEEMKTRNYEALEAKGGSVSAITDSHTQDLIDIAQELYTWAKANRNYPDDPTNPAKQIIKSYIRDSAIGLGLSTDERNYVISKVVDFAKEEYKKTRTPSDHPVKEEYTRTISTDPIEKFTVDIDKLLEEILATSNKPKIDRNVEIYRKVALQGKTYREIIAEKKQDDQGQELEEKVYPELNSAQSIKLIMDQVKGSIREKIGKIYELYRKNQLELQYPQVIYNGDYGEPDFICFDEKEVPIVESTKCLEFADTLSLPYTEHAAEIKAARKIGKSTGSYPGVRVHIFNRFNEKTYTFFIEREYTEKSFPYNQKYSNIRVKDYDR